MKELASLHDQHLNRPTLDDSLEQEHAIEITTQEITQVRMEGARRREPALPSLLPLSKSRTRSGSKSDCRLVPEFHFPTGGSQRDSRRPWAAPGGSICSMPWRSGDCFSFVRRCYCGLIWKLNSEHYWVQSFGFKMCKFYCILVCKIFSC